MTEFPASSKQTFTMFIDMPLPLYCPIFICKRKATLFETSLHPPQTHQPRKRHIDIQCLTRNALLLFERKHFERLNIMQSVGKLDHDDAQIFARREKHFAKRRNLTLRSPAFIL